MEENGYAEHPGTALSMATSRECNPDRLDLRDPHSDLHRGGRVLEGSQGGAETACRGGDDGSPEGRAHLQRVDRDARRHGERHDPGSNPGVSDKSVPQEAA